MRTCGECTLCCRLLPVSELRKPDNQRCAHQRYAKGCSIYKRPGFPISCRLWSCAWLTGQDTDDLSRPDRSHYVIDICPDYITAIDNETGAETKVQVVQIWVDPKHRDAHKDPDLRAYLMRRAAEGVAALIRYSASDGFVLAAPSMAGDVRKWRELPGVTTGRSHTIAEIAEALGADVEVVVNQEGTNP